MKKKWNIAIASGCLSSRGGGAPRSAAQHVRALKSAGCDATVFCGYNKSLPLTLDEFGLSDEDVIASPLQGPPVLGLFPGALRDLKRRAPEFDVIHLNGAWNLTTFFGARIAEKHSIPYVISCRSHYGEYHFRRKAWLKPILFLTMERRNIHSAAAMHVTSKWEAETSRLALGAARRIVSIPNSVDLSDFADPPDKARARRRLGLNSDGYYVIHMGRLANEKNLPFLLESFHEASMGPDATLLLVGPSEIAEKRRIQEYCALHALGERVKHIEHTEGRERCIWLAAADVFALPSHYESFCVAVVEAAACGTPCLVSPCVGAVEYLPPESVSVLPLERRRWVNALRSAGQRRKTSAPNMEILHDRFSLERIGAEWRQWYDSHLYST